MSLAPAAPLFPASSTVTTDSSSSSSSSNPCEASTAASFTELLAMEVTPEDAVLAFEGAFMPFVTVTLPPPSLSRSCSNESTASYATSYAPSLSRSCSNESTSSTSSYGYESDASSYSTASSGYYHHHVPATTIKCSFISKRHSPTNIDSYFPDTSPSNEYAQLAELWSASSSSSLALASRASMDSCADVSSFEASPNDALLDLFMQAPPASPKASATKITITASSTSSSSKHHSSKHHSSKHHNSKHHNSSTKSATTGKKTKSSKNKKCTYAARRREVSALRKETSALEKQLQELQIKIQERERTRESVELEKILLAGAREENKRLRAVVMSQEAQIRRSDGLLPDDNDSDRAADGSVNFCHQDLL